MPVPWEEGRIPWSIVPEIDEAIQWGIMKKMLFEDQVLEEIQRVYKNLTAPRPIPNQPPAPNPENDCAEVVAALHFIGAQLATMNTLLPAKLALIAKGIGVTASAQVLACQYLHDITDRIDDSNRIRLQQFPHRDYWVFQNNRFEEILTEGFAELTRSMDEMMRKKYGVKLPERKITTGGADVPVPEIEVDSQPAQKEYKAK